MTLWTARTCGLRPLARDNTTRLPACSPTCFANPRLAQEKFAHRETQPLLASFPSYDLTIEVQKVPLASFARLLRQAKKQIPSDMTATGSLSAEFHATRLQDDVQKNGRRRVREQWTGTGAAINVHLSSSTARVGAANNDVTFETIPLTLVPAARASSPGAASQRPAATLSGKDFEPPDAHLRLGPVTLATNDSSPMTAAGWVSRSGYRFSLRGDVELEHLFRLENILGLPAPHIAATGAAKLDVSVSGPWQGFALAATSGTAQLRNVRAEMRGFNAPIEISSATLVLNPDIALLQKLSAHIADTHLAGNVTAPRHCATADCNLQFDLTADQFSLQDLAEWFTPHPAKREWYKILSPTEPLASSPFLALRAQGSLHVGRLSVNKLIATQVSSQVDVNAGRSRSPACRLNCCRDRTRGIG